MSSDEHGNYSIQFSAHDNFAVRKAICGIRFKVKQVAFYLLLYRYSENHYAYLNK